MKKLFVILTIVSLLVFGSLGILAGDIESTDSDITIITIQNDDTPNPDAEPF